MQLSVASLHMKEGRHRACSYTPWQQLAYLAANPGNVLSLALLVIPLSCVVKMGLPKHPTEEQRLRYNFKSRRATAVKFAHRLHEDFGASVYAVLYFNNPKDPESKRYHLYSSASRPGSLLSLVRPADHLFPAEREKGRQKLLDSFRRRSVNVVSKMRALHRDFPVEVYIFLHWHGKCVVWSSTPDEAFPPPIKTMVSVKSSTSLVKGANPGRASSHTLGSRRQQHSRCPRQPQSTRSARQRMGLA